MLIPWSLDFSFRRKYRHWVDIGRDMAEEEAEQMAPKKPGLEHVHVVLIFMALGLLLVCPPSPPDHPSFRVYVVICVILFAVNASKKKIFASCVFFCFAVIASKAYSTLMQKKLDDVCFCVYRKTKVLDGTIFWYSLLPQKNTPLFCKKKLTPLSPKRLHAWVM